jgi:uncharacterized membrane protein
MKFSLKNELLGIVCLSLLLFLVIVLTELKTVRILLGFPFVLFFPGYVLTATLYPGKGMLNGYKRYALSIGLSIIIVPLIGLFLNYLPWGIRIYPVLIALLLYICILAWLGWYRRNKLPEEERFKLFWETSFNWSKLPKNGKVFFGLLIFCLLLICGTLAYVFQTAESVDSFTEFYILDQNGKTEGYPEQLKVGETGKLQIVIINHEGEKTDYLIEVLAEDMRYEATGVISLENSQKWKKNIDFRFEKPGYQKIDFLLHKAGYDLQKPYRKLQLWVNVLPE